MSELVYLPDTEAILEAMGRLIEDAQRSIILQMYLFAENGQLELVLPRPGAPAHAARVARWLIDKRKARPDVDIAVILDSNTPADPERTRARQLPLRRHLEQAGVSVLHANLFENHFDESPSRFSSTENFHLHWQSCPAQDFVARQNRWQVKKNLEDHRKNLVIDGGRAGVVTSHNLADISHDWYENGFSLAGAAAQGLWQVAVDALRLAQLLPNSIGAEGRRRLGALCGPPASVVAGEAGVLSSRQIRPAIIALVDGAKSGDELCAASAYFSDAELVERFVAAAERGVAVRVLVDGIQGLGLPWYLAPVLSGLVNHTTLVRAREHVSRCQSFQFRVHRSDSGRVMHLKTCARFGRNPRLIGGQANFTPNSFSGAWLETDIETTDAMVLEAFRRHFEQLWELPESVPLPAAAWYTRLEDTAKTTLLRGLSRFGLEP